MENLFRKGDERGFVTTSEILYAFPNIERDIDTIITKKKNAKLANFYEEIHTLFNELNIFLNKKWEKMKEVKKDGRRKILTSYPIILLQ